MDLDMTVPNEEPIPESPASPVPSSSGDESDSSATQMGEKSMPSSSPPATALTPEERIYKLMDVNLEQQKTIETLRRENRAAIDSLRNDIDQLRVDTDKYRKDSRYWHGKYEDLTQTANQMRKELEQTDNRSASPKRHHKESSATSSSEDSCTSYRDKEIQSQIDLRLNPFSEDNLKQEIAYSYGQPPMSLVAKGVIKRLYAEANNTPLHLLTPAM
ncbi:hypothetical protein C8J56DRAFT_1042924 [Mycena floridula]|nr:hypothetical protein C8J56DRAFT_1042924 [Mycena floridula]